MALKTMYSLLKREQCYQGFGNIISVANESAILRDLILEEMGDVDLTDPNAEEKFKNEAVNDEEMEELIDKLPETNIDDAAVAVGKLTNQNVPVNDEEYVGAPLDEALSEVDFYIPETQEF